MSNVDLWKQKFGEAPDFNSNDLKKIYSIMNSFDKTKDGLTLNDFQLLSTALFQNKKLKIAVNVVKDPTPEEIARAEAFLKAE